jgi:CheY-like chemotaxis protein
MTDSLDVLVVDDDDFNIKLMSEVCRGIGHSVRTAKDGTQALESIQREPPDLVLLDVMMPGVDGFGVLSQVRSARLTVDLPVIMVTASEDPAARIRAVDLGADDFVNKPFRIKELQARIHSVMAQRALLREIDS